MVRADRGLRRRCGRLVCRLRQAYADVAVQAGGGAAAPARSGRRQEPGYCRGHRTADRLHRRRCGAGRGVALAPPGGARGGYRVPGGRYPLGGEWWCALRIHGCRDDWPAAATSGCAALAVGQLGGAHPVSPIRRDAPGWLGTDLPAVLYRECDGAEGAAAGGRRLRQLLPPGRGRGARPPPCRAGRGVPLPRGGGGPPLRAAALRRLGA